MDRIIELPEAVILTDDQKRELDNRLDAYYTNPTEGSSWDVIRERIQKRTRSM
ncbi:MAG: addiction module protein [Sedimentisphaerales bacterium]|nr:addiction module protein [Sedimentisphaerales bacterium]